MSTIAIGEHRIPLASIDVFAKMEVQGVWTLFVYESNDTRYVCSFTSKEDLEIVWSEIYGTFRQEVFIASNNLCFRPESVTGIEEECAQTPPFSRITFRFGLRYKQPYRNADQVRKDVASLRCALAQLGQRHATVH